MKFNWPRLVRCEPRIETTGFPAIGIKVLLHQTPFYWRHFQQMRGHRDHFFDSAKEKCAVRSLKTSNPLMKNSMAIGQTRLTGERIGSRSIMSNGPNSWPATMKLLLN